MTIVRRSKREDLSLQKRVQILNLHHVDGDRPNVDVRAARLKLGMTQPVFSECFGVALPTLRKWEQGVRRPDGPARVLLRVIETDPNAVRRALGRDQKLQTNRYEKSKTTVRRSAKRLSSG
jgi:DNA-binding transcriptional regulator YiaG